LALRLLMKKYAVWGAGLMGRVVVQDLVETEADTEVALFDVSDRLLRETIELAGSLRVTARNVDVGDRSKTIEALRGGDVAIGALPHGMSLALVESAVEAGTALVDMVGSEPEKRAALHERAKEAGCLIVPGCGVAPGISNFCIGRGVELLDEAQNGSIYVGGIPKRKRPPLFYETVYLMDSVLDACERKVPIIDSGRVITVEPLTGLETISFPEPVGELEAYYTDGLASLPLTMQGKISSKLFEKTLRYPGHLDRIQFLKQCGLMGRDPVRVGDTDVVPRDLLLELLGEHLELGPEGDILVMRVIVEGTKGGRARRHVFELVDYFDSEKNHTAMGRTTGFTATCTARMIAHGELPEKGVLFPEQIFIGRHFNRIIDALAERGVHVTHEEA
jgi:lysine 6-dehydrogenase